MKILTLWTLLLPCAAAAGETQATSVDGSRVAVVGFRATGVDEVTVDNLTEVFTTEAGKVAGFKIIGTSEIRDLVGYQAQQNMLGCDDAACVSDLAGALGVDLLIAGSIGKVGETFVVNVRLIDVKRVETKERAGATIAGRVDAMLPYVRLAAWQILGARPPDEVVAANERAQAVAPAPAVVPAPEVQPAPAPAPAGGVIHQARRVATGVAGLGLLAGGALGGLWYWKTEAPDKGGVVSPEDAELAATFKTYGIASAMVGGVGVVAAIVLRLLEPEADAPSLQPTATGVAITF